MKKALAMFFVGCLTLGSLTEFVRALGDHDYTTAAVMFLLMLGGGLLLAKVWSIEPKGGKG